MRRLIILIAALTISPFFVSADTYLPADITVDTVLDSSGNPYYGGPHIHNGVTLTIQPGVIFKGAFGAQFVIDGNLVVNGTLANPVVFTSAQDVSDGSSDPQSMAGIVTEPWAGFVFTSGSSGQFQNAKVYYAGQYNNNFVPASIYNNGGKITLTNSIISSPFFGPAGYWQVSGTSTIDSTVFKDLNEAYSHQGGVSNIQNSYFENTGGVFATGGSLNLESSNFFNNPNWAVFISYPINFTHSNNSGVNNGRNGVVINGDINQDTIWPADTFPYFLESNIKVGSGANLDIEAGSIIKAVWNSGLEVYGSLQVHGSSTNPVYFTSIWDDTVGGDTAYPGSQMSPDFGQWSSIVAKTNSQVKINNAEIRYGGGSSNVNYLSSVLVNDAGLLNLNSVKISKNYNGLANLLGNTTILNSEISSNGSGVKFLDGQLKISQSSILNNDSDIQSLGVWTPASSPTVDAIDNWWGDATGPNHSVLNPAGLGEKIEGNINFNPWLMSNPTGTSSPVLTPVLIIPGIVGTELFNGTDEIWLDLNQMFTDTNDNFLGVLNLDQNGLPLVQSGVGNVITEITLNLFGQTLKAKNIFVGLEQQLQQNGYNIDESLFYFPYDWRFDLLATKDKLKTKIDEIKAQTGAQKVDIIAHSMGGLLTKTYIKSYGTSDINKLIFVGTPHLGAPKAAKILLEGDRLGIPFLENQRIKDIALNSMSVYELLPNSNYFNSNGGYIYPFSFLKSPPAYDENGTIIYLTSKGANSTLVGQLNNFSLLNLDNLDLSGVNAYNIAGCRVPTQSAYQISAFGSIGRIGYSSGDGTVPFNSADYVNVTPSNKFYVKNADHSEISSIQDVSSNIANILRGDPVSLSTNFSDTTSFCGLKGKVLTWHSPVDVHIYDNLGNHTGPIDNNSIEFGIPGVDYEIIGHEKFMFLSTENNQIYHVKAIGTGNGTFDLRISNVNNGNIENTHIFNDVPIAIGANVNMDISDLSMDNTITIERGGNLTLFVTEDTNLIGSSGNDITPPETIILADGKQYRGGELKKGTKISFISNDSDSGLFKIKYSLNNTGFLTYVQPLTLSQKGLYSLRYYSIDKAGNNEIIKQVAISIGK